MKIKISPLVFLMAAALIFLGAGYEFACYLTAVVLHEAAHAEVSRKLGYSLNVIKLMPYGASLTGSFEGLKRNHEIIIAVAGPLLNAVLALFCVALWWLFPSVFYLTRPFVYYNVTTAVFNLLPIYPLDGGRVLLAALSGRFKREKVYSVMRIAGIIAALIFCALFIFSFFYSANATLAAVAVFIFSSTVFPDKNSKYQRLFSMAFRSERLKKGLVVREVIVSEAATVFEALKMLNSNYYQRFVLVDKSFKKTGEITETQLENASLKYDSRATLLQIAKSYR